MKNRNRLRRFGSLTLALLLALSALTACRGGDTTTDTTDGSAAETPVDTPADSGAGKDPAGKPEDTPKTGEYVTTTDLTLPAYTYAVDSLDNNGILPATRDVWADTWTGTDGADRSMPDATATRAPTNRQVGIFYFLWRDRDQTSISEISPSDHYAAWLEGGEEALWDCMMEGGEGHPHYWAEPYFGYYSSNDEWVLRKHAYMLAEAGVDFVFFDTTNNNLHTVSHMALLKVWEEVRKEGYEVPKICFMVGSYEAEFAELYNTIYKTGMYEDLWFYWDGKPLVMITGDFPMSDEARNFFSIRYSWAFGVTNWYSDRNGINCWPWNASWPQVPGYGDTRDDLEQTVVMCGFGATVGRSLYSNRMPRLESKDTPWDFGFPLMEKYTPGLQFGQQFDKAIDRDPPLIMITGWNEWITGRWDNVGAGAGAGGQVIAGQYSVSATPGQKETTYFVDSFNPEYSRDIEPMKGGFGDNYLYQMAQRVREYKGTRNVETAFGQWAMDIHGSVGQWYAVGPEYRDYEGDVTHRLSPSHVGGKEYGFYMNNSGRNDIVTAKVSSDTENLYFYVECADAITDPEGANWMNLFINVDCDDATGWYGFDYLINRNRTDNALLVEKFTGKDTWAFETVGSVAYTREGNVMQVKLPKAMIGFTDTMDFKWADNSTPTGQIMEFLDQGDAAPNGRYTYRFTLTEQAVKYPTELKGDLTTMVVLKSRSYNAFVGGKQVRLVEDNTNGVLLASGNDIWLPVDFLKSALGIDASGETTYNHYGITYVKATDLVKGAGKVITVTPDGLVIIAEQEITHENDLGILHRALS